MEPIKNVENYQPAKIISRRPDAGHHLLSIHNATIDFSNPKSRILKLEFDIAQGNFKYYYSELSRSFRKNMYLRHQQLVDNENSIPYFLRFIETVELSNSGYKFGWQESTLVGKKVGAILRYEEYRDKYSGEIKTALKVSSFIEADSVDYKQPAPPVKLLEENKGNNKNYNNSNNTNNNSFTNETYTPNDDDLPF